MSRGPLVAGHAAGWRNDRGTSLLQRRRPARRGGERKALPADDPLRRQPLSATCLCVMYDPFSRTCAIASAGHPPPTLAGPEETPGVLDLAVGAALGDGSGPPFVTTTVPVADGDVLALYPAPLSAADRPEDGAGGPRLLPRVLADVDRPVQDLCDDVLYRLCGDALSGDAILLLARMHAFPADRAAVCASSKIGPSPARSTTPATPPPGYGTPGSSTRAAAACSAAPNSPRTGASATTGRGKTVWTEQPLPQRPE
ncbi:MULTISPECIES: PP2C family protein-serine/threonine phosphatase [Streptomyces]|nr:serine/threonine-protein phosphatase [Streptomyces antimycoticus]